MTPEELKSELDLIEQEFQQKRNFAMVKYAASNNPYKAGDIIKDHIGSIQITSIRTYFNREYSSCIYYGPVLKVNGEVRKDRQGKIITRDVYQSNIGKIVK